MMSLEEEFGHACEVAIDEARALGYNPTVWAGMVKRWGAVEAARRLMVSGDLQTGFERLVRMGRRDLTVEYAVLDERWGDLFSDAAKEAAKWRLEQAQRPI